QVHARARAAACRTGQEGDSRGDQVRRRGSGRTPGPQSQGRHQVTVIVIDCEKKRERALYVIGELSTDRPWDITIEPHKQQRSNTQNARLWALHTRAAEHTGYSPEEMHEF